MKAVVGALNQEKALEGAFSVITNIGVDIRFKLYRQGEARRGHHPLQGDQERRHGETEEGHQDGESN